MTLYEVKKIIKVLELVEAGQPVPPALLRAAIDAAQRHARILHKAAGVQYDNLRKAGVIG